MSNIELYGSWLTVNRQCNLRCKWCYADSTGYKPKQEIDINFAIQLTKLLKKLGIKRVIIIGGEPTLWKPFFNFNDFCKEIGMNTILVTNGLLFSQDSFFEEYQQHSNDSIALSIKAGSSIEYHRLTGLRNFSLIKKAFSRIVELRTDLVNLTYNSFYQKTMVDMVKFASDCGFKEVKIDFCTTTFDRGNPRKTYMVHPQKLMRQITKDLPEMQKYAKINFEMNQPLCIWPSGFIDELKKDNLIFSGCHVMRNEGVIFDTNGNVILCNALFDYPLGKFGVDFNDAKSYLRFRQSKTIKNYYDQIISYPSFKCMDCSMYPECGGGCPLLWFVFNPEEII